MITLMLLALEGKLPRPLYRALCRAYGRGSRVSQWVQAARPGRYRLMVSDGLLPAEEWVRWVGQYRMPIPTPEQAVARLRESEQLHPEYRWWIEPVPGARWHRPRLFDDDFAGYLPQAGGRRPA